MERKTRPETRSSHGERPVGFRRERGTESGNRADGGRSPGAVYGVRRSYGLTREPGEEKRGRGSRAHVCFTASR